MRYAIGGSKTVSDEAAAAAADSHCHYLQTTRLKQEAEARAHSLEEERNDAIQVARANCQSAVMGVHCTANASSVMIVHCCRQSREMKSSSKTGCMTLSTRCKTLTAHWLA